MATKSERVRKALELRGFKEVESNSQRPCMKGKDGKGRDVWLFLDARGGARYNRVNQISTAIPVQPISIERLLANTPSSFFGQPVEARE